MAGLMDNMTVHFCINLSARPSTDGKRAPLTAISLQSAGNPRVLQGSSAHIYHNDVVTDKI